MNPNDPTWYNQQERRGQFPPSGPYGAPPPPPAMQGGWPMMQAQRMQAQGYGAPPFGAGMTMRFHQPPHNQQQFQQPPPPPNAWNQQQQQLGGRGGMQRPHAQHLPSVPLQSQTQFMQPLPPPQPQQQYQMQPFHMQQGGMQMGGGGYQTGQKSHQRPAQHPRQQHQQARGADTAAGPHPVVLAPPPKRQKKKDVVPPLEKVTQDAVVRQPESEAERKEVDAWVAERRRNWPSATNLARRQEEAVARQGRGELELAGSDRQRRLRDVLAQQRAMGLSKQAGTEDLFHELSSGGGRGRGGRGGQGRGGRGGGGRGRLGWQAFQNAGDAPEAQLQETARPKHVPTEQQGGRGQVQPVQEHAAHAGVKCKAEECGPDEGLAALMGYGSDGEGAAAGEDVTARTAAGQNLAASPLAGPSELPQSGDTTAPMQPQPGPQHEQRSYENLCSRGRGRSARGRGRFEGQRGRGRGAWNGAGRGAQQPVQRPPPPRQPTLLEKLLRKEIRQDRSFLLQAFRFFITNDFLVNHTPGQQLKFPESGQGDVDEAPAQAQPVTAEELLASGAGIDIDISDELEEASEGNMSDAKGGSPSSSTSGDANSSGSDDEEHAASKEV